MSEAGSEPILLVEREDGIATLTLNRPAAMNALSRELRGAIATAFRDIATIRWSWATGRYRTPILVGLLQEELRDDVEDARRHLANSPLDPRA